MRWTSQLTSVASAGRSQPGALRHRAFDFEQTDATPPSITIHAPADNAVYLLGQVVVADHAFADGESGVASCEGTVAGGTPINTASAGASSSPAATPS